MTSYAVKLAVASHSVVWYNVDMKKLLLTLWVASGMMATLAQTPEQRKIAAQYLCLLNVKQSIGSGKKQTDWATSYGSHDKTQAKSLKYSVNIKWNTKEDADLSLEVIYMASSGQRAEPYSAESLDFSMEGGSKTNFVFESPVLSFRDVKYYYDGEHRQSGFKMKGAIIRLKKGDDIIRTYVSQKFWEKMSWDPEIKVKVDKMGDDSSVDSYENRQKATEVRLSSQERPPAAPPSTDVSPRFFKAERSTAPAKFKAQISLGSYFSGDFHVFRDSHYCLEIQAIDESRSRTYFHGYVRRASSLGKRVAEDFKQAGEHDGTVVLRYPRNAKSDEGCFLDDYSLDE